MRAYIEGVSTTPLEFTALQYAIGNLSTTGLNTVHKIYTFSPSILDDWYDRLRAINPDVNYFYLKRINDVIGNALAEFPRLYVFRADLRFPNLPGDTVDAPTCFINNDDSVITRFFESFKAQIRAEERRRHKAELRVFPQRVRYVWVREQGEGNYQHYHVLILLNKDAVMSLGNIIKCNNGIAKKIHKAWCSAINIPEDAITGLAYYPTKCMYYLIREEYRLPDNAPVNELLHRVAYMAKENTKLTNQGYRVFGCSQT